MNRFFHGGWNQVPWRHVRPPQRASWWQRWLRLGGVEGDRFRRLW